MVKVSHCFAFTLRTLPFSAIIRSSYLYFLVIFLNMFVLRLAHRMWSAINSISKSSYSDDLQDKRDRSLNQPNYLPSKC